MDELMDSQRLKGRCHCGNISFSMPSQVHHHALCHCSDCRRHSGAPMVGWALIQATDLEISGNPKIYHSSENGRRHFCADCGTSLFYSNEAIFPGQIDVQSATLDDPDAIAPQVQIQTAERLSYMVDLQNIPAFERYPG